MGGALYSLADPGVPYGPSPGTVELSLDNSILTTSSDPSSFTKTTDLDIFPRGTTRAGGTNDLIQLANNANQSSYYRQMHLYGRYPGTEPLQVCDVHRVGEVR